MNGRRLLFIDVLRTVAISFIVLQHLATDPNLSNLQSLYFVLWNHTIYAVNYAVVGVTLFIFASGLSLAVTDIDFKDLRDVLGFYKKRFLRIYPIYWVAVLFSFVLLGYAIPNLTSPLDYAKTFLGFQIFFATTPQETWGINGTYWFIGVIISLYLLYPLVLLAIKKHPHVSIIAFLIIEILSKEVMYHVFPQFLSGWNWFPLARIFEFALGVYVIRSGLYPKARSTDTIAFLGKLSFYVYLVHFAVLYTNFNGINLALFFIGTSIFATMFYLFDGRVQTLINKIDRRSQEQQQPKKQPNS